MSFEKGFPTLFPFSLLDQSGYQESAQSHLSIPASISFTQFIAAEEGLLSTLEYAE